MHMHAACTLHAHCMHIALHVHCMCTACALRAHCMHTACTVHCLCTACALPVHCPCPVAQVNEAPEEEQAFLCHRRGHWFALRALCGLW